MAEGLAQIIGNGPALRGDFEDFAVGVGQIYEDFGRGEGVAFEADTVVDFLGARIPVLGAGFQGAKNDAEGERGGGGLEFRIEVGSEPVAKISGAEGEDAAGIRSRRDAGAGLAAMREERRGSSGRGRGGRAPDRMD